MGKENNTKKVVYKIRKNIQFNANPHRSISKIHMRELQKQNIYQKFKEIVSAFNTNQHIDVNREKSKPILKEINTTEYATNKNKCVNTTIWGKSEPVCLEISATEYFDTIPVKCEPISPKTKEVSNSYAAISVKPAATYSEINRNEYSNLTKPKVISPPKREGYYWYSELPLPAVCPSSKPTLPKVNNVCKTLNFDKNIMKKNEAYINSVNEYLCDFEQQLEMEENIKQILVLALDFILAEFVKLSTIESQIENYSSKTYKAENETKLNNSSQLNSKKYEILFKEYSKIFNKNIEELKHTEQLDIVCQLLSYYSEQGKEVEINTQISTVPKELFYNAQNDKNHSMPLNLTMKQEVENKLIKKLPTKLSAAQKEISKKPQLPADDGECAIVIGPNGTTVTRKGWNSINWTLSASTITRKILMDIFDRNTLAFHTLTGKPSPAFTDYKMPEKGQLDPVKINDIIHFMTKYFKMTPREVRSAITTKCADENKMHRLRNRKKVDYKKKH